MNKYYELKIKPLHRQLGRDLGIKTINVQTENAEYDVPVKVSFVSVQGTRITKTNREIRNLRALGLVL